MYTHIDTIHAYIYPLATQGHVADRFRWGPTSVAWGPAAFGAILGYISPHNTNFRVSHPTVNTTHPLPGFLRGDAPWAGSRALHHSDQASLSTPAEVSTTLKISDIIVGLLVRLKSKCILFSRVFWGWYPWSVGCFSHLVLQNCKRSIKIIVKSDVAEVEIYLTFFHLALGQTPKMLASTVSINYSR